MMPTPDRDRLWRELVVEVTNRRAIYRGRPIELSPNTPFPFRMLACLREAFPSLVNKETLIEQVWQGEEGSDDSNYYKMRAALDRALQPHGLTLKMPDRVGMSIAVLHESKTPAAQIDPIGEVDYPSKVVVYKTWEPSKKILSKAERSITIVDGFFSEYWDLDLCVAQAMHKKQNETGLDFDAKKLTISVYMTSPFTNFGVHRKREIGRLAKDNAKCIELLKSPISDEEREVYRSDFDSYVGGLRLIEDTLPIELKVYEYFATPSTRMIVVDDKHFFFGWFPLWAHNPRYFCLYLEDTDLQGADREVLAKLRGQVDNFSSISKEVYPNAQADGNAK